MIGANELRIGNLVYAEGGVVEVKSLDDFSEDDYGDDGKPTILVNEEYDTACCEPLSLRLDIMLLLGFTKGMVLNSMVGDYYVMERNGFAGHYYIDENVFKVDFGRIKTEFKVVHLLQNAYYFLKNEELTIANQPNG